MSGSMSETALPPAGLTDRPLEDCVLSSPRSTAPIQSSAQSSAPTEAGTETPGEDDLVVEIHGVRRTVLHALRLFGETVVVPTLLVTILLPLTNLFVALGAALGWCYLAVLIRWLRGHRMPGTMMLCVSMLSGKACFALATGSAFVWLLQPALGSGLMALLFLGSALLGRPVTMRLARDFVHLPSHVLSRRPADATGRAGDQHDRTREPHGPNCVRRWRAASGRSGTARRRGAWPASPRTRRRPRSAR